MKINSNAFEELNKSYNSVFKFGKMSIGLVAPIENYASSPVPTMKSHIERVKLAESLGFSSIWLRDVPFNVPTFGDAGQPYDPFVYLGFLAAHTNQIALGVASIILPLRHPAHVAKAAASVDQLSGSRLLLGVASGDRPQEYPAMNLNFEDRGHRFRESYSYIKGIQASYPSFKNEWGNLNGFVDMLPKPTGSQLPILITGGSQQDPAWIAEHGNGWMIYPQEPQIQQKIINTYQTNLAAAERSAQPVMQPLYIDLNDSKNDTAEHIHLGLRTGSQYLIKYLKSLEQAGVNHVALNLRFNQKDIETTLTELAEKVLPEFI